MINIQDDIFVNSESDNWFLRNKDSILDYNEFNDIVVYYLKNLDSEIESVLELGSSNGFRLNTLKKIFPTIDVAVGVDPSKLAVLDGKERYGLEMYENNIVNFEFND